MSAINNLEFFRREDKPLDKYLKSVAMGVSVIQFFNCFFGYWISLDDEFKPDVSNWGAFTFGVILFYLVLTGTCFCSMVAIIQQWHRFMFGTAILYAIYFVFGLINVGLRANWFCFFLLFVAAIVNALVGAHFYSIELCISRGHHFTCRGRCLRVEQAKRFDEMLFKSNGTLIRLFGYDVNPNDEEQSQQTHQQSPQATPSPDTTNISFTNESAQQSSGISQPRTPNLQPQFSTQHSQPHSPAPQQNPFENAPEPSKTNDSNLLNF